MQKSKFVYVTYIRTTPKKLWQALTNPEFTRRYFYETTHESTWKVGASWQMLAPDGRVCDSGEVVEMERYRRIVLKWRKELIPEMQAEGYSRMTYEIEKQGSSVKLTVLHEMNRPNSKLIAAVAGGWPSILASLKSLLETGEPLKETTRWGGWLAQP